MRIAILGYGSQGRAAVDYWQKGNDITVCDANEKTEVPQGVSAQLGPDYLRNLEQFHLIVRSPAVHPRDIVAANSAHILKKVTTVTEEFFRVCPKPIIGVTGTKGKGTTSTLIAKILEASGKKVLLGGNIGIPPLDLLKKDIESVDWVVLELANFQLIDLRVSPKIAVGLMVVPEHLDWHQDMDEYVSAKQNLFRYQDDDDRAIFNRLSDYSTEVAAVSPALKLSYEVPPEGEEPQEKNGAYVLGDSIFMDDERVCDVSDVMLLGRHNLENVCAAIAAVWDVIEGNAAAIQIALHSFPGLPHRLEFVRELNEVKYYNDSFAATPQAAAAAVTAIPGEKVLIAGGFDRKLAFDSLVEAVTDPKNQVKSVMAIGQTRDRLAADLQNRGFKNVRALNATDMATIVREARDIALPHQKVILSPGCPSFDMFKNFEDRGLQFKAQVDAL